MTDITPLIQANAQIINGYSAAGVRVNGHLWPTPVIVTPDETQAFSPANLDTIDVEIILWARPIDDLDQVFHPDTIVRRCVPLKTPFNHRLYRTVPVG
jgi:hypothetical protein